MQKFIKYFLKNKAVTWLLLVLILAGGLFSYAKMGKLEDAPFTIKQALRRKSIFRKYEFAMYIIRYDC